jgi:DNA modification methylase
MKPNQCSPSPLGGFNVWEPILFYGKLGKRVGQDGWIHPIGAQAGLGEHPCPKSQSFWKRLMLAVSDEGNSILDPFLGSGTTTQVAKELNRKAIGIEINERYCEIAANRLRQEVLQFT